MSESPTSNPRALIESLVGYVTMTSDRVGFAKALQAIEAALMRTAVPPNAPTSNLRACPFCGGEAATGTVRYSAKMIRDQEWDQDTFHFANCTRCGASNVGLVGHRTPELAAERWNTRSAEPPSARLEEYELPCDVHLPPNTYIGRGCKLSTLMHALRVRERSASEFPVEFPHRRAETKNATASQPAESECSGRSGATGGAAGNRGATVEKSPPPPPAPPPKRVIGEYAPGFKPRDAGETPASRACGCMGGYCVKKEQKWTLPSGVHCFQEQR